MLKTLAISILISALLLAVAAVVGIWILSWQAGLVVSLVVVFGFSVNWASDYLKDTA